MQVPFLLKPCPPVRKSYSFWHISIPRASGFSLSCMMPESSPLFRKTSLPDQAASALRAAIRDGFLRGELPGEIQLSRQFGISRPTLRAALARLQQEGMIVTRKGRGSRVMTTPIHRSPAQNRPGVCIISPLSRTAPLLAEHPVLLELQAQLVSHGISYEEIFDARLAGPRPFAALRSLAHARPHVCWVLLASTSSMQAWYSEGGLPALVLGSCHPETRLPSIDRDYRATGWHAAGELIRHGHSQVGLVLPASPLAGDLAFRNGFKAYMANRSVSVSELVADDNPAVFRSRIDRFFRSHRRPTALLILRPAYSLALVIQLLRMGFRIPEDASIISRDTHPLIDTAFPDLTRYSSPTSVLATRTIRLAESLLGGKALPPTPIFITPHFIPGSTLGTV